MIRFRSLIVRALLCVAMPVAVASAQGRSPLTLDIAAQAWTGRAQGEVFSSQGGLALDAVVALRARTLSRGAFIVGAGAAAEGRFPHGDVCRRFLEGSECKEYPSFSSLMLLGGLEGFGGTVRALVGPAVFRSESGSRRGDAAGLEGRVDLATPPFIHVSFVLSARGAFIPNFHAHKYRTGAMGVGVRFQ